MFIRALMVAFSSMIGCWMSRDAREYFLSEGTGDKQQVVVGVAVGVRGGAH